MTKQLIMEKLSKLVVKSETFLEEYVDFCISKSDKSNYQCVHHILPKSKNLPFLEFSNLKNNEFNAAYLSYSEHFYAHWLLANAIKHKSITHSFIAMMNKDSKNERISIKDIDTIKQSEDFEKILLEHKKAIRSYSKNMVVCIDENGETVRIPKSLYDQKKHLYTTHSSKKIAVVLKETGEKIRISSEDYNTEIHSFHLNGKACYVDIRDFSKKTLDVINVDENFVHQNSKILVNREGENIIIVAKDSLPSDKFISKSYRDFLKQNKKVVESKIKYFDLEKRIYFYEVKSKKLNPYTFIQTSHKKNNKFFVICRSTFDINIIYGVENIYKEKHIFYNSALFNYYIDVSKKDIIVSNEVIDEEGIVKYSIKNAKKYLNQDLITYKKTDKFYNTNINKRGYVTAYDTHTDKIVRVTKEEFDKTESLIGIKKSEAVARRRKKKEEEK